MQVLHSAASSDCSQPSHIKSGIQLDSVAYRPRRLPTILDTVKCNGLPRRKEIPKPLSQMEFQNCRHLMLVTSFAKRIYWTRFYKISGRTTFQRPSKSDNIMRLTSFQTTYHVRPFLRSCIRNSTVAIAPRNIQKAPAAVFTMYVVSYDLSRWHLWRWIGVGIG